MVHIEEESEYFNRSFAQLRKSFDIYKDIVDSIKSNKDIENSHCIELLKEKDNCIRLYFLGKKIQVSFSIEFNKECGRIKPFINFDIVNDDTKINIICFEISDSFLTNKENGATIQIDGDSSYCLLYFVLNFLHSKITAGEI